MPQARGIGLEGWAKATDGGVPEDLIRIRARTIERGPPHAGERQAGGRGPAPGRRGRARGDPAFEESQRLFRHGRHEERGRQPGQAVAPDRASAGRRKRHPTDERRRPPSPGALGRPAGRAPGALLPQRPPPRPSRARPPGRPRRAAAAGTVAVRAEPGGCEVAGGSGGDAPDPGGARRGGQVHGMGRGRRGRRTGSQDARRASRGGRSSRSRRRVQSEVAPSLVASRATLFTHSRASQHLHGILPDSGV